MIESQTIIEMSMWSEKSDKSCHDAEMNVSEQRRRPRDGRSPKHYFFCFRFIVLINGLRKIVLRSHVVVVVVVSANGMDHGFPRNPRQVAVPAGSGPTPLSGGEHHANTTSGSWPFWGTVRR